MPVPTDFQQLHSKIDRFHCGLSTGLLKFAFSIIISRRGEERYMILDIVEGNMGGGAIARTWRQIQQNYKFDRVEKVWTERDIYDRGRATQDEVKAIAPDKLWVLNDSSLFTYLSDRMEGCLDVRIDETEAKKTYAIAYEDEKIIKHNDLQGEISGERVRRPDLTLAPAQSSVVLAIAHLMQNPPLTYNGSMR